MGSPENVQTTVPDRDNFLETVIIPTGISGCVVSAFEEVDRAEFMYRASRDKAYTDEIIDLTPEATISQPSLVARMIDLLQLEGREKVLEIGTATGYQAALLSRLASHVDTVEIDPRLAYWANSNLQRLGYTNVTIYNGDGAKGLKERAPFDAIIVTAGLRGTPQTLIEQLAVGGRLVAPIGDLPEECRLIVLTKTSETEISDSNHGYCRFVPLYSPESGAWTAEALEEAREQRKQKWVEMQKAHRSKFREAIIDSQGKDGYEEFIRQIGRPAASIVDKSLTEDQVLDLFDFFASVFKSDEQEEKPETKQLDDSTSHDADNHD